MINFDIGFLHFESSVEIMACLSRTPFAQLTLRTYELMNVYNRSKSNAISVHSCSESLIWAFIINQALSVGMIHWYLRPFLFLSSHLFFSILTSDHKQFGNFFHLCYEPCESSDTYVDVI